MVRWLTVLGSVSALVAVAAGAFGAHALRDGLSPRLLETFEIGARYHMYHSLALFAVAWLATRSETRALRWAGGGFLAGIVLFSGSLYAYALSGTRLLSMVTPLGGLCFMFGWLALALGAWKSLGASPVTKDRDPKGT